MNCIEPDVNRADEIGYLQSASLHRLKDLADLVSEDPASRVSVDAEMHRQIKCVILSIERNCGFATT